MKVCLLSFLFYLGFLPFTNAQFGLRAKYNNQSFSAWDNSIFNSNSNDNQIFNLGYEVGLDYWFRLKKRRVEFMPEIAYSTSRSSLNGLYNVDNITLTGYYFNFNTHIYALDMEGDCDCPTFSKQGPSINKGLFFHFTPGIGYLTSNTNPLNNATLQNDEVKSIVFRAGIGLGLDIGINDLITITPIVSYYFHSGVPWENIPTAEANPVNATANPKNLQFTLRVGFRPDYINGKRRRR
jgi:hypothetical protein